jgi:hypothetical protein
VPFPAIPEEAKFTLQQFEPGPSMIAHIGIDSTAFNLENQQVAEQLVGFAEWDYHQPDLMDDGGLFQNPGTSMFARSNHWNGLVQSQMPMPTEI